MLIRCYITIYNRWVFLIECINIVECLPGIMVSLRQSYSVPGCIVLPRAAISMVLDSITVKKNTVYTKNKKELLPTMATDSFYHCEHTNKKNPRF